MEGSLQWRCLAEGRVYAKRKCLLVFIGRDQVTPRNTHKKKERVEMWSLNAILSCWFETTAFFYFYCVCDPQEKADKVNRADHPSKDQNLNDILFKLSLVGIACLAHVFIHAPRFQSTLFSSWIKTIFCFCLKKIISRIFFSSFLLVSLTRNEEPCGAGMKSSTTNTD